jgi:hypothetical protein
MKFPLAIASFLVPAALLAAQPDRLTINMAPGPNQTVNQRTTTDMVMTAQMDTAGKAMPSIGPQNIVMKTTMEMTLAIGPTDNAGHYSGRGTIDTMSSIGTVNGTPLPIPVPESGIVGTAFTFQYDDQGKIVDVDIENAPAILAAVPIKQMLTSAMASASPITLAVGESITVPTLMNLPMPPAGQSGAAFAMSMKGETTYTLTSITFDGADRIAHLATRINGTVANATEPAGGKGPSIRSDATLSGEGTVDINVDRGLMLRNEQRMTTDTTMHAEGSGAPAMPSMRTHGTARTLTETVKK